MRTKIMLAILNVTLLSLTPVKGWAGEATIDLREYLGESWSQELLTYAFNAPEGECDASSITLTGPRGAMPVQLSEIEYWPGTQWVKSGRLSFITDLAPLAGDTYTVRYSDQPVTAPATDLRVTPAADQVEIVTSQFGARLLLGDRSYPEPVASDQVPGPVIGLRLADGTWFGGSSLYGPGKVTGYSARLTESGPIFAGTIVRYTYENGNTLDLNLRLIAGDNTIHCETTVAGNQPEDGFNLVISRGLPQLIFQVQDEARRDRECFNDPARETVSYSRLDWAEIPLADYVTPEGKPAGLVTNLSPWEDWFGTFTQTRIRLKMEGTERELQVRALNPGAWVEPREIEEIFSPNLNPDPMKGMWLGWGAKLLPIMRSDNGEIALRVNGAQGVRKWTISDCLSMPGVAALIQWHNYRPESTFPPETRPTVGLRLDEVKGYVLDWPGDAGTHPRLFIRRDELEARWKGPQPDAATLEELLKNTSVKSADQISYMPNWATDLALGAYLLTGSAEIAERTMLLARLRKALNYELYGMQFGHAGAPAPILYDGVIDEPWVPEADRQLLRSRMAYYGYRLADPAVWSAERGFASGNQNMTVTWEISRGLTACVIPEHPMAKVWYAKAERIMEYFLNNMVGPAGEWPEAMGGHGRTSIDMVLAFAVASSNSGLRDYVNDPRVKRMVLSWAKMLTPRDPRPRGHAKATPNRRYFPAMGRDPIGGPGGTCGVLARLLRQSDPELAEELQWAWIEEGAKEQLRHLGAFAYVSCDSGLAARTPAWRSEVLPYYGAMLRHGLGTAEEHQVILYSGDHFAAFYTPHTGSFASIFAYGVPVAGAFPGGYEFQEGFLTSTVDLAREVGTLEERQAVYGHHGTRSEANPWGWPEGEKASFGKHGGIANVSSFSALPRQDYAAVDVARHFPRRNHLKWKTDLPAWPTIAEKGQPPVDWRRQTLFLKDDDPARTSYLVIRDSISGNQPTMWQMWNVSETIDTPEKVRDVDAVLASKPGEQILPARQLQGDRFTAIGQLGVDVEYYIASPTDTPRHTLRWGTDMIDWANKLVQPEYQDLLHLQMPGDGVYFLAFFPRKRNTPAPLFSTLGEGTIIKVTGDFGTDYSFLAATETTAAGEGASFTGTAASVQDRLEGLVLSLGASGEVRYREIGLAADIPASLRVRDNALTVELPASLQPPAFGMAQPFPGGILTVTAPGNWTLAEPLDGLTLTKTATGWALTVPAACRSVTLIQQD